MLYSFSEFPLWYVRFLYPFAFLVALLDTGFEFKNLALNKFLAIISIVIASLSAYYFWAYNYYLYRYEVIMYQKVINQEKIDAYKSVPKVFGFTKFREEMLNMVADEDTNNPQQLMKVNDRLIHQVGYLDIMRMQARMFIKMNKPEEADKLYRAVAIIIYQQEFLLNRPHDHGEYALQDIKQIDPQDKMGYAKRLQDFYKQRFGDK